MKAKIKYHDGASGLERHGAMWDMAASETVTLSKGEVKVIPLGVSMKLPDGFMGLIAPRSSTCLKHGIIMANSIGIIENEYCGDGDVWGFGKLPAPGGKLHPCVLRLLAPAAEATFISAPLLINRTRTVDLIASLPF